MSDISLIHASVVYINPVGAQAALCGSCPGRISGGSAITEDLSVPEHEGSPAPSASNHPIALLSDWRLEDGRALDNNWHAARWRVCTVFCDSKESLESSGR